MSEAQKREAAYSAKVAYQDTAAGVDYEARRFRGVAGRLRRRWEDRAVTQIIDSLPAGISIADVPCGTGRWWPYLLRRATSLRAFDVSEGMVQHAEHRRQRHREDISVELGDAEHLQLADGAVDYVFSFALTKHLPVDVQERVLCEFARVARRGVVCTFGVLTPASYALWRVRRLPESYPLFARQLGRMADAAGLEIRQKVRCTSPLGVEFLVHLVKPRR